MIGNAAVAGGLALLALAIGQFCRCPAVRHALWLVVLLKLVTPPLFSVPLRVLPANWNEPAPEPDAPRAMLFTPSHAPLQPVAAEPAASWRPHGIGEWLVAVWAAGSLGWFAWQGRRILRFRRSVNRSADAPVETAEAAARIAAALGIAKPPAVRIAAGIGSPMLWGWGRGAVVLFPRELLARLAPEARDTLLAHELAHYLRRDHWVRFLEFAATGLYWWHPAVWLARREIEWAEEECCDAWVVGGLAASPRSYAEALLATVDYEAELRRPVLPPAACAAHRSARLLQRRLVGIIDAREPRKLPGGRAIRFAILAALLTRPVLTAASANVPEPAPETPSATGKSRAAAGPGPLVRTWDDRGTLLNEARVPAAARSVAHSPDGSRLVILDAAGGISVLDPHTLASVSHWSVEGPANSVVCSPDGGTLAVSFGSWLNETGWVECWSVAERKKTNRFIAAGPVGATRFAPDGKTLVIGMWSGQVLWRSLPDGNLLADRDLPKDVTATAAFCPEANALPLVPPVEIAPPPVPIPQFPDDFLRNASMAPDR